MEPQPIKVYENAWRDQFATGFRYLFMAGSSIATALGLSGLGGTFVSLEATAGPLGMLAAFLYGQWSARHNAHIKAHLTANVSDDVATFK